MSAGIYANLGQWHSRYLHDPDFIVFHMLAEASGQVLDIGANRGHSALSTLRHTRRLQVFSIEPNPEHRWSLLLIKLLHPFRFRFRQVAAGNSVAQKTLYIPGAPALGQSAWGSLDPAEFEKAHIHEKMASLGIDCHDKTTYQRIKTQVIPLDKLQLSPDLIKIDVEGFEFQTLQGLQETLDKHHPALIIEANHPERWLPMLKCLGYDIYYFKHSSGKLNEYDDSEGVLNIFCLHKNNQSRITQALLAITS